MIAFLHTMQANVAKFDKLMQKHYAGKEIKHYVKEELLERAIKNGIVDEDLFSTTLDEIKTLAPEKIICTCSSYGELSDKYDAIERIDRPIVEHIIKNYTHIGIAYTASSTKVITDTLLRSVADSLQKQVTLTYFDSTDSFSYFEKQDYESYGKSIADTILNAESEVDVIFLAQASMEVALNYLKNYEKEVFTSPEYGIKKIIR